MRVTPLEPGLPGPSTLLHNHPIWGIMPINHSLPINSNNDDGHYEALVIRQTRNDKNLDTSRNYDSFSIGCTVVVQWEKSELWTYGTVVGRGDHNHSNRSYMIRITKNGWEVRRNSKHVKATPITAKQYLGDQLTKYKTDPLDEILKHHEKLAHENVTIIHDRQGREDTYMNSSNDTWHSNLQEHNVNEIPVTCKWEKGQMHILIHWNRYRPDENASPQTCYGRVIKNLTD